MIRDYKHVQQNSKPRPMATRTQVKQQLTRRNFLSNLKIFGHVDKRLVAIVLGVIILTLGYLLIFRPGTLHFTVAEFDRIHDQFESKGLLVKSEQVFYAPYAGKVSILTPDGERVPAGDTILELDGTEGKKVYFARQSGLVSFQLDGLETTLKPVMLENFQQNYRDFRGKLSSVEEGEKVNAGRPLFKLVDNFVLYMLVEAPAEQVPHYKVGSKVWATFEGITIIGWVEKILANRQLFILRMERFPDEVVSKRWVNVTLMTDIYSGIVVPRSALIELDGQKGVFIRGFRKTSFQPVEEVEGTTKQVVVSNVDRGDEVLINPEKYLAKLKKKQE